MMFLIRAALWLAVVSVFVPRDFAGETFALPENLTEARIDAGEPVSDWCADNAAICDAGREAARLGGFLTDMAATRIEAALDEREAARKS
jgi:hypothetical protein